MTKILGIETCTNICSVALWDGVKLHEKVTTAERSHSRTLLPMIAEMLQQHHFTTADLDFIACARGPGSFTGVRIGVGAAKGLAYGQDLAIIAVSPLAAIAYRVMQTEKAEQVTAIIDARMGELYVGDYRNQNGVPVAVGKERLRDYTHLNCHGQTVAGTGVQAYRQELSACDVHMSPVVYPHAGDIVMLARLATSTAVAAADFAPLYLRDKVTY